MIGDGALSSTGVRAGASGRSVNFSDRAELLGLHATDRVMVMR
jgi:hypothetical protein